MQVVAGERRRWNRNVPLASRQVSSWLMSHHLSKSPFQCILGSGRCTIQFYVSCSTAWNKRWECGGLPASVRQMIGRIFWSLQRIGLY